jgi:hypothetical protein
MGQFRNCLNYRSKWFAQGRFVEANIRRNAVELIRPQHDVTGKTSIHAVTHSPPVRTKNEIPSDAVTALAAGDGRRAQTCDFLPALYAGNFAADFHHGARELMAQDYGRIIPKSILKDMDVGST